jgi:hypothetical protein
MRAPVPSTDDNSLHCDVHHPILTKHTRGVGNSTPDHLMNDIIDQHLIKPKPVEKIHKQ